MFVAKEEAWRGIGSHINICPAIVTEIRSDRGHPVGALGFGNTAFLRHIAKDAVALITIQITARHRQPAWTTIDGDTLEIAIRIGSRLRQPFQMQIDIVGYEKIQVAVAIIVEKGAPGSPANDFLRRAAPPPA